MRLSEGWRGAYSQRTPCLISALSSGWVFGCGEMGREMRGAEPGSLFCRVRGTGAFSWLDIVKWGQPQGQQECSLLISPEGAGDTRKKSKRLCRKTPVGHFSSAALLQLADLKLSCKYQMTPTVMKQWFKTHFPLFITSLPFHWYFDRFNDHVEQSGSCSVFFCGDF